MGLRSKSDQASTAAQESKDARPITPASQTAAKPVVVSIPAVRRLEEQDFSNTDSVPSVESHGYRTAPSSPAPPQRSPRRSQQSFSSDGEGKPPKTPVAEVKAETLSTLSVTPKASELSRPAPVAGRGAVIRTCPRQSDGEEAKLVGGLVLRGVPLAVAA